MQPTLTSSICDSLRLMGGKQAVLFLRSGHRETNLSYERLNRDSDSLALSFAGMGIERGDCAVIFLPKCVGWVVAHIALLKVGAICVPLNPGFKTEEVEYFLGRTNPRLIVSGIEQEKVIREIDPDVPIYSVDASEPYESPGPEPGEPLSEAKERGGPGDPALIVFTSGTTGRPKGAVLTQGNLSHDAQNVIDIWEIAASDRFCHALPLFHVHGLCFALHTSLIAGATIIMLDSFDPAVVLNTLSSKDTTMFMAVPTMYQKLLAQAESAQAAGKSSDYSHLRLLTSGSAPLLAKDFERIRRIFDKEPVEREGMSETLMNFSNPVRGERKPGSIGLPLPHLQVRLVGPDTLEDVSAGELGEIWLKGPSITPGYWNDPEETERAFVDGYFRTGDLARRDEDGYYFLTDRIKQLIISGGENISPKEIERVINTLDDVRECAVVGIPDENWGEIVAAAVVVGPGSSLAPEDIRAACKERLLDWKCPKRIVITGDLPKNQMGKILQDEVRKRFFEKA